MRFPHKLWRTVTLIILAVLILYPVPSYPWHVIFGALIACTGGVFSVDLVLSGIGKRANTEGVQGHG